MVHKAVEPSALSKGAFLELTDDLHSGGRPFYVQPKLDGVCGVLHPDGTLFSRTGQVLQCLGPPDLLRGEGRPVLFGEIWAPGLTHQEINGMARRKVASATLQFHAFDCVPVEAYRAGVCTTPYRDRLTTLLELFDSVPTCLRVISNERVPVGATLKGLLLQARRACASACMDGLILRRAEAVWKSGAGLGGEIIKIKPTQSADLRVVGTTPGKGQFAGQIGALIVDLGDGRTCEVGSGLTPADRVRDDLRGSIVEVEYLSLTSAGLLREPRIKAFRFDKTEADLIHKPTED